MFEPTNALPAMLAPPAQINAPVPSAVLAVLLASVRAPSAPIAAAPDWIVLPVVPENKATALAVLAPALVTTEDASTPESATSLPVVPLKETRRSVTTDTGPTTTEAAGTAESTATFEAADHDSRLPVVWVVEHDRMSFAALVLTEPIMEPDMFKSLKRAAAVPRSHTALDG